MDPVERIYREWDECLARKDSAAIVALYAPDAVMEIEGGPIRRHRVYWGWFAVGILARDAYRR